MNTPEPTTQTFKLSAINFGMRIRAVIFAAVAFTLLSAASYAFFLRQTDSRVSSQLAIQGISRTEFEEYLSREFKNKTPQQVRVKIESIRLQADSGTGSSAGDVATEASYGNALIGYASIIVPLFVLSSAAGLLISFVAAVLYLIIALEGAGSAYDLFRRLLRLIFPVTGLFIWSILRSFAWVPIAGIFSGAYYLPRFAFAPVILIRKQSGIIDSVKSSAGHARGRWFGIVGNFLILGAVLLLAIWFIAGFVAVLAAVSPKVALVLWMFAVQLIIAYSMFFLVQMSSAYMGVKRGHKH